MDNNPFHDYEEDSDFNLMDYNDDVADIRLSLANRTLINRFSNSVYQSYVRKWQSNICYIFNLIHEVEISAFLVIMKKIDSKLFFGCKKVKTEG